MRLPRFEYLRPDTIEKVLDLLSTQKEDAKILAGGTDLLVRMKKGLSAPKVLISLIALKELSFIKEDQGCIRVGTNTPIIDIINSKLLQEKASALVRACEKIGAVSIQHHRGTIGGNILQNNRCHHYNQSDFHRSGHQACHKAGGKICYAREEGDRCYSTCQSDGATALMALDAKLILLSSSHTRTVKLTDFYTSDGIVPFAMESDELLKEIVIPDKWSSSSYYRLAYRSAIDYPIVCAGVSIVVSDKKIDEARIVVGAMGRAPLFLAQASSFLQGKEQKDNVAFKAAADKAMNSSAVFAVHNVGATLEYRCDMVSPVVFRALNQAALSV